MRPTYYRGCWHVVSRRFFCRYTSTSSLLKEVYNPKAVIPHAASLRQASAHCARSLTAATRRCLGRVPVPVWPTILSDRPPVTGLVHRYHTNYLMGRAPLLVRPKPFLPRLYPRERMRYYPPFPEAIPHTRAGQARATQPSAAVPEGTARLACLTHAASVCPEPGSNSPNKNSGLARGLHHRSQFRRLSR